MFFLLSKLISTTLMVFDKVGDRQLKEKLVLNAIYFPCEYNEI